MVGPLLAERQGRCGTVSCTEAEAQLKQIECNSHKCRVSCTRLRSSCSPPTWAARPADAWCKAS